MRNETNRKIYTTTPKYFNKKTQNNMWKEKQKNLSIVPFIENKHFNQENLLICEGFLFSYFNLLNLVSL